MTSIEGFAFFGCSKLTVAGFLGMVPTTMGFHVFDGCASTFVVNYISIKGGNSGFGNPWLGYPTAPRDTFTAAFNLNGASGTPPEPQAVFQDFCVDKPADPARSNYTFGGWYQNTACMGSAWDFNNAVTADITLYAKWTSTTCTVTFNSEDGTAVAAKTVSYNTLIAAPAAPKRAGYIFTGWYKNVTCTTPWNFTADKVTANITLYAKWISTIPASVKAVSTSYTSITVSWAAVPNAKGYEVWQSTAKNGKYTRVGTPTGTSFSKTGLATGTMYYYKVRSYTLSGSTKVFSSDSSIASAWPKPAKPATLKAARASSTSIKLTWGKVTGATKYEIWRHVAGGNFKLIATTTSNFYTNTKLTTGKLYYYEVRACCMVRKVQVNGDYSVVASAKP